MNFSDCKTQDDVLAAAGEHDKREEVMNDFRRLDPPDWELSGFDYYEE